ncbi:uncharacterized protein BDV14DRAFT_174465 [Aspergillus stella-maris]|uniref:uncharacterized protein n=1 Tax=Aspergillus stella-maris TaxID=1810926 RepID=UPI003CCD4240
MEGLPPVGSPSTDFSSGSTVFVAHSKVPCHRSQQSGRLVPWDTLPHILGKLARHPGHSCRVGWELGSVAKLLRERDIFLDTASATGDPLRVYDVQWGSVFPCYNSAAAASVAANAFGNGTATPEITQEDLNDWIIEHKAELLARFPPDVISHGSLAAAKSEVHCGDRIGELVQRKRMYGRAQQLDIVFVSQRGKKARTPSILHRPWSHRLQVAAQLFLAAGTGAVLLSLGCIGKGVLLLVGSVSFLCSQFVQIKRSPLYLRNREVHTGCMLVAVHENATI